MTTVLWVLGVWLLATLPVALFIGRMCSLNRIDDEEERSITSAPTADHAALASVRLVA